MKRPLLLQLLFVALLVVCIVPQAQASAFMRINVDGTIVTCDNSAALCGAGFTTAVGGDSIQFTGTVNGVNFGGGGVVGIQLTGNSPGTPAIAFILDTKSSLTNTSAALHTITIDTGLNNFTTPSGPGFLHASQTANWTVSTAGESQAFTVWLRNTNDFIVPGGNGVASTAACVSPGGLAQSCDALTANIPINAAGPYALTSREVITLAPGSIASFTATNALTATPINVPEPGSLVLLGTGMLMVVGNQLRKRWK